MKTVLLSDHPKWCELIAIGKKTIDVRKTRPKLHTPFKCYIYCTKGMTIWTGNVEDYGTLSTIGNGKVIGEFVCDMIENFKKMELTIDALRRHIKLNACMEYDEIFNYLGFEKCGYGWHISNLKIYDKPRDLNEFYRPALCEYDGFIPLTRPPQSWCYVEEVA